MSREIPDGKFIPVNFRRKSKETLFNPDEEYTSATAFLTDLQAVLEKFNDTNADPTHQQLHVKCLAIVTTAAAMREQLHIHGSILIVLPCRFNRHQSMIQSP